MCCSTRKKFLTSDKIGLMAPYDASTALVVVDVHVIVTGPPARRESIRTPFTSVIATTGIVIAGVPVTVGEMNPGTLLYSTTLAAPALCALNAFW